MTPLDSDLTPKGGAWGFNEEDLHAIRLRADELRPEIEERFGEDGYEIPDEVWGDVQRELPRVMGTLTQQGAFVLSVVLSSFVAMDSLADLLKKGE